MKWRMNIYQALAMMEVQREHMLYFGNRVGSVLATSAVAA